MEEPQELQEPSQIKGFDKTKLTLPVSILVAALLIAGSIIYVNKPNLQKGTAQIGSNDQAGSRVEVSADDDPFLGNKNAPVTIIEFSDFQCPFCRRFWKETLSQIIKEYVNTGKAKFVYRDFPLSFHEMAQKYAEAAECAEDQGRFWQMHDKIFEEQDKRGQGTITGLTVNNVKGWAREIGLNGSEFDQCLDSGKYAGEVGKDFNDGSKVLVGGTPTIFVNGRPIIGAQAFSAFKAVIDEELQRVK